MRPCVCKPGSHALNVACPLSVEKPPAGVCTQVQVNFRNGTHPPPFISPPLHATMWNRTNIVNNNHKSNDAGSPPPPLLGRMKILTSIQKHNKHERGQMLWQQCSNHAGIHDPGWEMSGRRAAAHANSIKTETETMFARIWKLKLIRLKEIIIIQQQSVWSCVPELCIQLN